MLRLVILWIFIGYFSINAWRNWFLSLCVLIPFTAFIEYPDLPRSMFGVPGLNPWNILFLSTFLAWIFCRSSNPNDIKLPPPFKGLIILQMTIFIIAFARIYLDQEGLANLAQLNTAGIRFAPSGLINTYLVDTIKWMIPFFMMYYGANTPNRQITGLLAILGFYLALALLILKVRSLGSIVDEASLTKGALKIVKLTGYHRVDASSILAGGSWLALALIPLQKGGFRRFSLIVAFIIIILGQLLTGGRTGYLAWAVVGCLLAILRWRKILPILALVMVLILAVVPAVRDRMLVGLTSSSKKEQVVKIAPSEQEQVVEDVSAGRYGIWLLAYERIQKRPFLGYGRLALLRTGASKEAIDTLGQYFGHPHNAYLELVLDNGLLGAFPFALFYFFVLKRNVPILRTERDPVMIAIAAGCFAVVVAHLTSSLSNQTFYPRTGSLTLWCVLGLFLRVLWDKEHLELPTKIQLQKKSKIGVLPTCAN